MKEDFVMTGDQKIIFDKDVEREEVEQELKKYLWELKHEREKRLRQKKKKIHKLNCALASSSLVIAIIIFLIAIKKADKIREAKIVQERIERITKLCDILNVPSFYESDTEYISRWFVFDENTYLRIHTLLSPIDPWNESIYLEIGEKEVSKIAVRDQIALEEMENIIENYGECPHKPLSYSLFVPYSLLNYFFVKYNGEKTKKKKRKKEKDTV